MLMTESRFTRGLSLERKRTERSRKPFVLLLMDIEGLSELNSHHPKPVVHEIVTKLGSLVRETDTTGWYRDVSVLGIIFTELGNSGHLNASVESIVAKISSGLERQLGRERSDKIKISYHVFPEDWSEKRPAGVIDPELYPELRPRQNSKWLHGTGKRFIDLALSGLALFALSPLFLLIAIAVKLSSEGPVLFRQKRVGRFGKQFTFLKFRSMRVYAETEIHERYVRNLIAGNVRIPEDGVFKIQNDPRVTLVGRFLRRTSLDELPQFWNVLTGEMSLVGPRPPLLYEVAVYDLWHRRRLLEAKPGITGLWQVTGRSRTCFDDMVRLDLHYTRFSSLWLDLNILSHTPGAAVAGDGAY